MTKIERLESRINKLLNENEALLKDQSLLLQLLKVETLTDSARHALRFARKNDGIISSGLLKSKGMSRSLSSQVINVLLANNFIVKYPGMEQIKVFLLKDYSPWIHNSQKALKEESK